MANRHRGSVALKTGDREYSLSFSVNALCELEDHLDKPIADIVMMVQDQKKLRISTVRAFLWGALRDHHPEIDLAGAGSIISDAGLHTAAEKFAEAFRLAFPEANEKGNPQTAAEEA